MSDDDQQQSEQSEQDNTQRSADEPDPTDRIFTINIHRDYLGELIVGRSTRYLASDEQPYVYIRRTRLNGSVALIRLSLEEARAVSGALALLAPLASELAARNTPKRPTLDLDEVQRRLDNL